MQPFINRTQSIRHNVEDIHARLRELNSRLVGPQPPAPAKTRDGASIAAVQPLLSSLDSELTALYEIVDALNGEVNHLYDIMDLPRDMPKSAASVY